MSKLLVPQKGSHACYRQESLTRLFGHHSPQCHFLLRVEAATSENSLKYSRIEVDLSGRIWSKKSINLILTGKRCEQHHHDLLPESLSFPSRRSLREAFGKEPRDNPIPYPCPGDCANFGSQNSSGNSVPI